MIFESTGGVSAGIDTKPVGRRCRMSRNLFAERIVTSLLFHRSLRTFEYLGEQLFIHVKVTTLRSKVNHYIQHECAGESHHCCQHARVIMMAFWKQI
jgi:hypothetical protein